MRRVWQCVVLCALLLLAAVPMAASAATAEGPVWGTIQENSAILYLSGAKEEAYKCQVGNVVAEVKSTVKLSDLETPVETVVVIDNSLSIQASERPVIKEILSDLIANRLPRERYTIATISDDVTYLCKNETNYTSLKAVVDSLEHKNQYTQLSDGLYHILEELRGSNTGIFRRILIIADGVDNKQVGYTKDELHSLIQTLGYPIYTVGCTNQSANGIEELQELFALSRMTSGAYFSLPDVQDTMSIITSLTAWNEALQVTIDVPSEVCDGMNKMLQVTGENSGAVYQTELTMPLATVEATPIPTPTPEAAPTPVPTPEPVPEPEPAIDLKVILLITGGVVLAAVAAVVCVVLVRRGKKKDLIEEVPEAMPLYDPLEKTEFLSEDDGHTEGIWDQSPTRRLILEDLNSPSRRIEVPLRGSVIIGRDASVSQVVLTDLSVARQQCRIYEQNGWVMIANLSRSNITKLDGQPVSEERELPDGSTLQMGRARMRVELL